MLIETSCQPMHPCVRGVNDAKQRKAAYFMCSVLTHAKQIVNHSQDAPCTVFSSAVAHMPVNKRPCSAAVMSSVTPASHTWRVRAHKDIDHTTRASE